MRIFISIRGGCEANYSIRNSSKDRRRLDVLMIRIRLNEVTSILSLKKTCTPGLPAPMPQDLHEPIWAFVIAECLHNKSFGSKGTIVISILRESLIYIINYIFENLIIDDTVVSQKKKIFSSGETVRTSFYSVDAIGCISRNKLLRTANALYWDIQDAESVIKSEWMSFMFARS